MLGEYGRFQVLSGHRSRIWKHFNAPTHTDGESSCGVVALCPCQSTSFTRPEYHSIKPPYDRFLILFSLIPLHPCMYCMALIHSFVEYFNIVILSHSILSIRLFFSFNIVPLIVMQVISSQKPDKHRGENKRP